MKLTKKQAKEIRALKRMKDEEIDLTDIPELVNPTKLFVGKFYRPIKKSLTIRIDADILAWVKGQGRGYQTRINTYLRQVMYRSNRYPSRRIISLKGERVGGGEPDSLSHGNSKTKEKRNFEKGPATVRSRSRTIALGKRR
jgi:uncharacterized protein (DUF4415 family)